jgi:glycosyltransferase involved in cell wall biosynthesis
MAEAVTPPIPPVPSGTARPLWSVMIPVCNRTTYLLQAIDSVLSQGIPPEAMQICIVDNSTQSIDWTALFSARAGGRIEIVRQKQHLSICDNWNSCIAHARGHLVHILHDDDFVLPGFYDVLSRTADRFPGVDLFACRALFIDEQGIVLGVTERLPAHEAGGTDPSPFFYRTPVQTPGVAMRRRFYESHGGFMHAFPHCADVEMWSRAISMVGGVVVPDVLCAYRTFATNHSGTLRRTAENLRDIQRLYLHFADRYPTFDRRVALQTLSRYALDQADTFRLDGDAEASAHARDFVRRNVPLWIWLRRRTLQFAKRFIT